MSGIKDILKGLAEKGKLTHEVTIQDTKFVLRTLSTEEQLLAETVVNMSKMKDKYDAKTEINSYSDTLAKMRNISLLAFSIMSIEGIDTVEEGLTNPEMFKRRLEFRDDLASLPPATIDALLNGHRELTKKALEFYADAKENLGK